MTQRDVTARGHPTGSGAIGRSKSSMATYRVVVACPQPRHEFTVTVDPGGSGNPAVQACEFVFALLNIGCDGIDDLPDLGHAEHTEAVRGWYAHHGNLSPGVTLEVTGPDDVVLRLACDWIGCAHPDGHPASTPSE